MPSWNEKLYVPPMINVNLKPCDCLLETRRMMEPKLEHKHWDTCSGAPILVPCPIPRSVTFEVRLGECVSACGLVLVENNQAHADWCPARPVKVSCSIGGETWESTEVTGVETAETFETPYPPLLERTRERWALMKALVLGNPFVLSMYGNAGTVEQLFALHRQRDAVFAALRDMRRSEIMAHEAFLRLPLDLRRSSITSKHCGVVAGDPRDGGIDLPSARILAHYVDQLLERVGVLQ